MFDMIKTFKSDHDLSANYAKITTVYEGRRYLMAMAIEFEAKANVSTRPVQTIGTNVDGAKAGRVKYSGKMKIIKCTEFFDKILMKYVKTGAMPRFDIQTYNEDPAAADLGRSIKDYIDCILDGDVLLSLAKAEGGSIEQEISFICEGVNVPEYLTDPSYM